MITKEKIELKNTRYSFGYFLLIYFGLENMEAWQARTIQSGRYSEIKLPTLILTKISKNKVLVIICIMYYMLSVL